MRSTDLRLLPDGRSIRVALRLGGMSMLATRVASGSDEDVIADRWESGTSLPAMAAAFPAFGSVELAEARERGDTTEYQWRDYYENPGRWWYLERMRTLIDAAFAEPRLRAVQPSLISHYTVLRLHLPRGSVPSAQRIADDSYLVRTADRREVGTGDGPRAVELLLRVLGS
ncbi:MAG TPA: hypothetical protein VL738_37140 [Dactylosporangium sp.]|nr:hypothetical protein [Dactylosporangium sp.]